MFTPKVASRSFIAASSSSRRFATTLIVGDNHCGAAVTAAQQWKNSNEISWLTTQTPKMIPSGITKVFVCESPLSEALAEAAIGLEPDSIVASHDKQGSTVIPYISGRLQRSCVTDVISFIDSSTIIRPMYAGNALVKVNVGQTNILSIRPTAFEAEKEAATDIPIETLSTSYDKSNWVSASAGVSSSRPDLTSASTVVSGGRGLGTSEQFQLVESLADAIGDAAVGASRAAVDAGMYANDAQVGQTGKVVAPDLYVAAGISGAIQHVSGMKDSKIIVAVNKDPDAPIFQIADYGLVQDLFTVLPEMTEKIQKKA